MNKIIADEIPQRADMATELRDLKEQVEQARAELAQLRAENAAKRDHGTHPVPELLAANEQLVVAALRSETRFRAYFDVSPEYLYLLRLTAEDRFVFEDVNPAGAHLYGLSREQIIGRTPADLDDEDGGESINIHGRLALRLGQAVTYEASRIFGVRPRAIINTIVAPVESSPKGA